MNDEVDLNASNSNWLDSFVPDGQQVRQSVDALTQERVRHLPGIQISSVPADQNIQLDHGVSPDPNLVPNRPGHTLTMNQEGSTAQAKLAFNPQPWVSSSKWTSRRGPRRRASSAPLVTPGNPSGMEGRSRVASRGVSSASVRPPGSPSGMEGRGRGASGGASSAPVRPPGSPVVTWAHVAPGPWRPRSPASRREPRVRRDGDRNYLDFPIWILFIYTNGYLILTLI